MRKLVTLASLCVAILYAGCTTEQVQNVAGEVITALPVESAAIIVSLTKVDPNMYGGWNGDCPGCDIDGQRMVKASRDAGISRIVTLTNSQATTFRFLSQCALAAVALKPSAEKGKRPLLLIYVSGHGGQVANTDGTETDGQDETLCLWDGQLVDDLMWNALVKIAKGVRVVIITDTCNSGTNYKSPRPYTNIMRARSTRSKGATMQCDLLHIGGCADGMSSYGSAGKGGELTYALAVSSGGPNGKTWKGWYESAKGKMPRNQTPTMTVLQTQESLGCCKIEELEAMK